jgi:integrase
MRRYYLHTRHNGTFYAELVDEKGFKLTARSTGKKSRDEALLVIADWLKNGIPTGKVRKPRTLEAAAGIENVLKIIKRADLNSDDALRIVQALKDRELIDIAAVKPGRGSVSFTKFLEEFWDYEVSPYVREKKAHGQSIGLRHCSESMSRFNRYWQPAFQNKRLNNVTRHDLKNFSMSLAESGLAPASVNKIMAVGVTCISWAFREGFIPVDPTIGLVNFSGEAKKRGILTPIEAQTLFAAQWRDKRAYIASLLSCTTGLRSGEVLALKLEDIGERVLNVRHSWSDYDKLKAPKNGETRKVPLLPEVRVKLLELASENPHGADGFIFYGNLPNKPIDRSVLLDGLHEALAVIGIDAQKRGIVFHSWRHYYAAQMADHMTADKVARITGHRSKAIFEKYADHISEENLEEVGKVGEAVFENILSFKISA